MAIQEEMSHLKKDINIVVSSAAGATGIAFIQYARANGFSRIVGIAGSDSKCQFVCKLGCIGCVNYKTGSTIWVSQGSVRQL
jgi:NADPH-dependent curcumin reductase CurA